MKGRWEGRQARDQLRSTTGLKKGKVQRVQRRGRNRERKDLFWVRRKLRISGRSPATTRRRETVSEVDTPLTQGYLSFGRGEKQEIPRWCGQRLRIEQERRVVNVKKRTGKTAGQALSEETQRDRK